MTSPVDSSILTFIDQYHFQKLFDRKVESYCHVMAPMDPLFAHELRERVAQVNILDDRYGGNHLPTTLLDLNTVNILDGQPTIGPFDIIHFPSADFLEFPFLIALACRRMANQSGSLVVMSSDTNVTADHMHRPRCSTHEVDGLKFLAGGEVIRLLQWVNQDGHEIKAVFAKVKPDSDRWRVVDLLKKAIYR